MQKYFQTSSISHTLAGNKLVDHSDVDGASLQPHLNSRLNTWLQWITARRDGKHSSVGIWCTIY